VTRRSLRNPVGARPSRSRRAFSLVEVLIALTITATLLTATMAALDASFKSYKANSESAATNIVARIVMQRLTAMIRTGESFGPYPANPIITPDIQSSWIEFVAFRDPSSNVERIVRLERRDAPPDGDGPFELWYIISTFVNGEFVSEDESPLLTGINDVVFDMEYDVGPRLRRVSVDLIIQPQDAGDAAVAGRLETPTIRLVTSASPRAYDE
jgi:prepilin-type N-terminal cleavage/methylation domain-containing protein